MSTLLAPAQSQVYKNSHQPTPGLQIQHGGILLVAGRCNGTYRYSLHPSNKTRVGGESCFQDK